MIANESALIIDPNVNSEALDMRYAGTRRLGKAFRGEKVFG